MIVDGRAGSYLLLEFADLSRELGLELLGPSGPRQWLAVDLQLTA